jgi:hypothetical protein
MEQPKPVQKVESSDNFLSTHPKFADVPKQKINVDKEKIIANPAKVSEVDKIILPNDAKDKKIEEPLKLEQKIKNDKPDKIVIEKCSKVNTQPAIEKTIKKEAPVFLENIKVIETEEIEKLLPIVDNVIMESKPQPSEIIQEDHDKIEQPEITHEISSEPQPIIETCSGKNEKAQKNEELGPVNELHEISAVQEIVENKTIDSHEENASKLDEVHGKSEHIVETEQIIVEIEKQAEEAKPFAEVIPIQLNVQVEQTTSEDKTPQLTIETKQLIIETEQHVIDTSKEEAVNENLPHELTSENAENQNIEKADIPESNSIDIHETYMLNDMSNDKLKNLFELPVADNFMDDSSSDPSDLEEEEPDNIEELYAEKLKRANSKKILPSPEPVKQIEVAPKPQEPSEQILLPPVKKIRKKMNELEKLQNDLNRSIDCDSFIKSSIKPRTCTMQKVNDEKKNEMSPCWVKLFRLNLTSSDMPVKVDAEMKFIPKVIALAKAERVAKKRSRKLKASVVEKNAQVFEEMFKAKFEPEPLSAIVFETFEPIEQAKPEPVIHEKIVAPPESVIHEEIVAPPQITEDVKDEEPEPEPKKPKLSEIEIDDWMDESAAEKVVKFKSSMKLKKFKKLFEYHCAGYDLKHPEVMKLRKSQLKKKKKKAKLKKALDENSADESVLCEEIMNETSDNGDAHEEVKTEAKKEEMTIEAKKVEVKVSVTVNAPPPPMPSCSKVIPEIKIQEAPIVVRKIINPNTTHVKIVAVKPLPRVTSSFSLNTSQPSVFKSRQILIVSPMKNTPAPEPTQPRAIKPLPAGMNQQQLQKSTTVVKKIIGRIIPKPSNPINFSNAPAIVNMPSSSSSSIRIASVTSESARVGRIPITLPQTQTDDQVVEIIDVSDDDEDEVTGVDILRPWIEQSKFKSKKNSKACKAMVNKHGLAAFYKCMGSTCCFYTSEKNLFQIHLELHRDHQKEDAANYLMCSYCEHRAKDIPALIVHINMNHGGSIFRYVRNH